MEKYISPKEDEYLVKRIKYSCEHCGCNFYFDYGDETVVVFHTSANEQALFPVNQEGGYNEIIKMLKVPINEWKIAEKILEEEFYPYIKCSPKGLPYKLQTAKPECPFCKSTCVKGLDSEYLISPQMDWLNIKQEFYEKMK